MSKDEDGWLGKLRIVQHPESVFYKDEGSKKNYYLFAFFVLEAEESKELVSKLKGHVGGRGHIPVDCTLLYENGGDPVEDQTMLEMMGSSTPGDVDRSYTVFLSQARLWINSISGRKSICTPR